MSYVRYRCTHYNTTGASTQWTVDIIDTVGTGLTQTAIIAQDPEEDFQGLPQDMIPGIYPTSYRFQFMIQNVQHEFFRDDVFEGDEERFIVKVYRAGVIQFIGWILADQCSYEDAYYPYVFNIEAVDGLYKLSSVQYRASNEKFNYYTITVDDFATLSYTTTFLTDGNVGGTTQWTVIEHFSDYFDEPDGYGTSHTYTTYARMEQYAASSPGTGWVDQGGGLWAKAATYSNELIEDTGTFYHLTRDIDDEPRKTIAQYMFECLTETGLKDEYAGLYFFSTACNWYEANMGATTDDTFEQTRLHEKQFIDKTYADVLKEICKMFYLRLYYAQGMYHFETITVRTGSSFTRFLYDNTGVTSVNAVVNLDINLSTYSIKAGVGGIYKSLPPLKEVAVYFENNNGNFLDGVRWSTTVNGETYGFVSGQKYIGRVRQEANHHFKIVINTNLSSSFDSAIIDGMPGVLVKPWSRHICRLYVIIRVYNKSLGTTNYLQDDYTWNTTYDSVQVENELFVTNPLLGPPETNASKNFAFEIFTAELPGSEGNVFDIYMTVAHGVEWVSSEGNNFWNVLHAGEFEHKAVTSGSVFISVNDQQEEISANSSRAYVVENGTTSSTKKVEFNVLFSDYGKDHKSIEIYDGADWIKSNSEWSENGTGTGVELLELLVQKIMSLRVTARRIYNGAYLSTMPSADNRLLRDSKYYLPLRVSRNDEYDTFEGDFVEIAQETPPSPDIIDEPDIQIFPPLTGIDQPSDDPLPLVLETNEAITAGPPAITECDITNTAQVYVPAGAIVKVIHPTLADTYVTCTLTQAIEPASTVMYFNSVIWLNNFPDASPIVVEADMNPEIPTDTSGYFWFFAEVWSGAELEAPSYTFPDTESVGALGINQRIEAYRNGNKITYNGLADTLDAADQIKHYMIDTDLQKFIFPIPLDNESLFIKAW